MAGDAVETEAKDVREMEIAHLDLRYAHTRILKREHLVSLAASIEQRGQIIPVVTVAPRVLVDGYRRVAALKLCKRDTVMAEHWSCGEREAVFRVLRHGCERRWDVVEQAAIIQELIDCHKMSRARVARQLGKTPSWVTRRLDLLHALPREVLKEVKAGHLSSWAASRVLAPLARANADHAGALGRWVVREHVSTRELADFFDHYQSAPAITRERMVADPSLFMKALRAQREKEQAGRLRAGPEGRWLSDLLELVATLRRLNRLASGAPYPGHKDRPRAIHGLEEASGLIETLKCGIRSHHDCERLERGCPDLVPERHEDPPDQHDPQGIEEHRAIDPARQG